MIRFALSSVKFVVRFFLLLVFIPVFYFVFLNLAIWWNCGGHSTASLTSGAEEAFERGVLIALYKPTGNAKGSRIAVERLQFNKPWEYVFYTPKYYSERFCVNSSTAPDNATFIVADGDTTVNDGLSAMEQLPVELKVFLEDQKEPVIYLLDQKFQDNIDHIPSVPFLEKWDSGPFLNDD